MIEAKDRMPVSIVCDLVEEGWPSMDLFAAMLAAALRIEHAASIETSLLRPPMRRRATLLPGTREIPAARNADRLLNRFVDYPRWLSGRARAAGIFHVIDHSYAQLVHVLPAQRTVVTCHDIDTFRVMLDRSAGTRKPILRAMARRILSGLQKAARVTCVSTATRNAVLRHGLLDPDRLDVVYPGVDGAMSASPDIAADGDIERFLGRLDPHNPELLHVGSTIERKRIDVLLRIFVNVRDEFPTARLIRVGGPFTASQASLCAQLGLEDSAVQVLPYLDRRQLAAAYRRASLVLQPSEAEGFGLPVAEAMACGTPVVASDLPALREVGGDTATYCPVGDVPAWSRAVAGLLAVARDDVPAWAGRRRAAVQQAATFSWSAHARRMATIYRQVLHG